MKRIYEIDLIRGIMIIAVVFYHILFDLQYFYNININVSDLLINICVYSMSGTLIFVSGISSVLGKRTLKRGLFVFIFGSIITLITYIINHEYYVTFGILSLLGFSMVMAYFLKKVNLKYLMGALIALVIIVAGIYFINIKVDNPYIFWAGLVTKEYQSLDHYPIFPWFGVFLMGFFVGKKYYASGVSPFKINYKMNFFAWSGRHSLAIYIIHQPFVMAVLWLLMKLYVL